ncbi:protein asterix [Tanacetum coccineum]|uniref:Protein asterix n=1 Tax=Tanacetum coccineum TaxID=301880 RepID=A0ABQ4YNY3_9ASTR
MTFPLFGKQKHGETAMFPYKLGSWLALIFCAQSLANMRNIETDLKQISTGFMFAVMGMVTNYLSPAREWLDLHEESTLALNGDCISSGWKLVCRSRPYPPPLLAGWKIRQNNVKYQMPIEYEKEPALFSIKLHHAGKFKELEKRKYVNGLVAYVNEFDIDKFSIHELNDVMVEL